MMIRCCLLPLLLLLAPASAAEEPFYLGTYTDQSGSQGIYLGSLDSVTGRLGPITLAAPAVDPSFLALSPRGDFLYAALENWQKAAVEAFKREPDGRLTPLNSQTMGGADTCFVSYDPTGPALLAANFNSGNVACFGLLPDGSIGGLETLLALHGSGPNPERQKSSHAHYFAPGPDGRCVYACDLGSDKVWIYRVTPHGALTPNNPPFAVVPPGSGPRHLVFDAKGRFAYVSSEMGHSVTVFSRDASTDGLTPLQTISVVPPGTSDHGVATAEVVLHPNGRWLYASSRNSDTLAVFVLGTDGRLTLRQSVSALVKSPRSFAIDPGGKWLISAGQNDNRIAELKIDPATGELTPTSQEASVGSPACVLFVTP